MKRLKFYVTCLLMGVILSACSEEIANDLGYKNGIQVEVSNSDMGGMTRMAYAGLTQSFENTDAIGLYVVNRSTGAVVLSNVKYTFNGTAWSTSTFVECYNGYDYYAYYPWVSSPYTPDFSKSGVDAIFSNFITDSSNKFYKTDQSTKANFQASDLMIAKGSLSGANTVSFMMGHKRGLAVFDGEDALSATFTGNIPYTISDKKYFLMKPSTNTEFKEYDTYTLNAPAGSYVRHSVEEPLTNFVLNVTAPSAFTYAGGTNSYSIQSYKTNSDGTKQKAAPWTASYDTDGDGVFDDAQPSWLTAFTASGDGSTADTNYNATVSAQTSSSGSDVTSSSVLASAAEVTDYDLSQHTVAGADCSMTTANCYLVHAPGTYKLPLVYGNAIKNGSTNSGAYNPSGSNSDTFLKPFLNHAGSGISDPWLKNNGATPDGASLIWQDVNGMISTVGISGDYLTFTVDKSKIAEGNAVIAATKSGTVVWSWHIWVTPETLSTLTSIVGNSITYKVAPVNLGWVNSGTISWTSYDGRSCTVKISQLGGHEKTFVVSQSPSKTVTESKQGYNTYYQWGRKDPEIPAASYNSTTYHAAYNISGSSVSLTLKTFTSTGTSDDYGSIANGIKYPLYHYKNDISDNSGRYGPFQTWQYNLWDANNTTTGQIKTKTVKTIYDPCPAGFCIPTSDLWYKMSRNSSSSSSSNTWDNTNKGRLWTNYTPNVFFTASGYSSGSSLGNVGSSGYYWSASPMSSVRSHDLYFTSSYCDWNNGSRAFGFPVRAVAEE